MDISQTRGFIMFICAAIDLFFALIVWSKSKENRLAFHLGFLAFFAALFSFTYGFFFFFDWQRLFWVRCTWTGVLVVASYVSFVYVFTGNLKNFRFKSAAWYSLAIAIIATAIFTPYIVRNISNQYPYVGVESGGDYGPLAFLGRIYIVAGLFFSLFCLWKHYLKIEDPVKRRQLQYFIAGLVFYTFVGVLAGGVIPIFNPNFDLVDISALFSVPWVGLTVYAIFRNKLFDIKFFLTEVLVYFFGLLLLAQLFFKGPSWNIFVQWASFILFCFIGYLLIKANRKEIQKSEVLEEKVAERTKELQASNQGLKEREEELTKFYNLTVGREVRMAELKEKIKSLEEKNK
ncbi:MAG: hypothetical protein WC921_00425 [Candidatus Paceibacterota bacterium]|jgi:hypothetical protein